MIPAESMRYPTCLTHYWAGPQVTVSFGCQSLGRRPLPLRPWDGELGILVIDLSVKIGKMSGDWNERRMNTVGPVLSDWENYG